MTEQQQPQPMIALGPDDVALILRPGGGEIRWGTMPQDGTNLPQHAGLLVAISARLSRDPLFARECVQWFLASQAPAVNEEPAIDVARPVQ